MDKQVKNWIISAEYDLETAQSMFSSKRYLYAVFMCHLSLEKILKAKVQSNIKKMPPKTHDLLYLLELSNLTIDADKKEFLTELSNISVVTRYPSDFNKIIKSFSRKRTEHILKNSKETFLWIKKYIEQ